MSLKTMISRLFPSSSPLAPVSTAKNPQNEPLSQLLDRVYAEAISPNADGLATVLADRDVALVFYEIGGPDPATDRMVKEGARALGWQGGRVEVGRLPHTQAGIMADEMEDDVSHDD